MTLAAVYLRISKSDDHDDESMTLETQRRRIRPFCDARDWEYGPEYIDDGISATKARDATTRWSAMLQDLNAGKFDVIVARDLDRLLRTLQDLVKLIDLNAKVATVDGEIDLTTADGEFRATMLAAVARFEIRRKSERAIHANETRRRRGLPVQRTRILGYDDDGVTQIDDEAAAVKKAFEDYLNGIGMAQIARDLNAQGFTTTKDRPWATSNLRSLFGNTRYKGVITKWESDEKKRALGVKRSEIEYPGDFEAIVTPEVWNSVQLMLTDPLRKRDWGTDPKSILTGMARCGRCGDGTKVFTSYYQRSPYTDKKGVLRTFESQRIYACLAHKHLSRRAEPVDDFVEEQLLWRLSQPDAKELFDKAEDASIDRDALQAELKDRREKYEGLATLYSDGILDLDSVREQAARLRKRMTEIDSLLAPPPSNPGRDLLEASDMLEEWNSLNMDRKRYILEHVMTVTILPAPKGRGTGFDSSLVQIDWV
ncbi:MAG: recombinase family protein [Kocuria sp.]|nr:recombinase family protein [Kocuria sp.]